MMPLKKKSLLLYTALASLLIALFYYFGTPPIKGRDLYYVKKAVDGDTIELATGAVVRYVGIDTPETVKPNTPVECYGPEASKRNKQLVEKKYIKLEADVENMDQYGRILRYVYLEDGQMVNKLLVTEGYAESKRYNPNTKYQQELDLAEINARSQKLGMWGICVSKK